MIQSLHKSVSPFSIDLFVPVWRHSSFPIAWYIGIMTCIARFYYFCCSLMATQFSNCMAHFNIKIHRPLQFICCSHMATKCSIALYMFIIQLYHSFRFNFSSHMTTKLSNCMIHLHHTDASRFSIYLLQPYGYKAFKLHDSSAS